MVNLSKALVLLCSLLIFSGTVSAEGRCPPGYFPTNNPDFVGCAPSYGSRGYDSGYSPASASKPPDPGARWKFRWGAIATDDVDGKFGVADGFERPSQANKTAIKDCRKNGGKQCKLYLEYYNQCAALVGGDTTYSAHRGPLPDEVKERALGACNKVTTNCQIYYVGCSYPVEVE